MQHSSHPYGVVLNALEKGFVEQGMDSSTRNTSSMKYVVVTWGRRAGRRRRTRSLNPMDFQTSKRINFHGVALLNSPWHHSLSNVFEFAALHDLALLTSLLHFSIKLHSSLCVKCVPQYMQSTENT